MSKHVTVGLRLDSQCVRLLRANVELNGGWMPKGEMSVADVLVRVVLAEARGATEQEVHAIIPPKWRSNIEAVSNLRKVE